MTEPPTFLWTDAQHLQAVQYRDETNLAARQSIYAYQQPRLNLPHAVLELLELQGDEVVIDVGCGNGGYLRALTERRHHGMSVGIDFSPGMLARAQHAAPSARLLVGGAASLPLGDAVANLALAAHMLYHVPEPHRAVGELRRVIRADGRVAVVLNGLDHLGDLRAALAEGLGSAGVTPLAPMKDRLDLDAGEALLKAHFARVARTDFVAELVITEQAPLEAYVRSMIASQHADDVDGLVAVVIDRLPRHDGTVRIRTHSGCLIAVQ